MDVKVRIELYTDRIKALENAMELSEEQAADAVRSDIVTSQTTPKETGELERNHEVVKLKRGYAISNDQPYARRLYWHPEPEYNFRKDKNPNADGLWMQTYQDGAKKNFFRDAFRTRLKENAKGLMK